MEIKSNKVFYSELPSRNIYVDSVVNDLPGYYPARSEFTIEYDNEAEQDLTDVCFLYDQIVNKGGEESSEEEEEEDPLRKLLAHVKEEPETDDENNAEPCERISSETSSELGENSCENASDKLQPCTSLRGRKRKHLESEISDESKRMKISSLDNVMDIVGGGNIKEEFVDQQEIPAETSLLRSGESCKISESNVDVSVDTGAKHKMTDRDKYALEELCLAAIDIYNNRLRERNERKRFVRNHGFLDQKKVYSWYNIHNLELGNGLMGILLKKFIKLFDTAFDFDTFVQRLKLENELRIKLSYLDELRSNGIRHKKMIPLYNQLKENRNKVQTEISHLDISDILSMSSFDSVDLTRAEKKVSKKLEIAHLPMYKSLTLDERELCSTHRLTPESYLNFKYIMIDECKKLGGLKLAQARPLLKIDVNKTRKVYDYLIAEKLIWRGD